MPAISLALLSAEQLRLFLLDEGNRQIMNARLLNLDSKMFYCPTCDQMVTIHRPIYGFRAKPWRGDVFKWRS